jgi:hypothetical protein
MQTEIFNALSQIRLESVFNCFSESPFPTSELLFATNILSVTTVLPATSLSSAISVSSAKSVFSVTSVPS